MTFKKLTYLIRNGDRTLAVFGAARLVKDTAGRVQLIGGSLDDRRTAKEWCSLCLHTATFSVSESSAVRDYF